MVVRPARRLKLALLLAIGAAAAQEFQTLEQAASRSGRDFTAVFEGRTVAVRGQVATGPVWALGTYYVPLRDPTDHGLLMRGDREQFRDLLPGDWVEVQGAIQSRAGLPLLDLTSIRRIKHDAPPEPKDLTVTELCTLRYLGLVVRTEGAVTTSVGENLGGTILEVSDRGSTIAVFLPRADSPSARALPRLRVGDRVRLTGLATQYSLEPPHDGGFQIMLATPSAVEVLETTYPFPTSLFLGAAGVIALVLGGWWIRERRMSAQHRSMRAFHALSEEIISAASPAEISEKLATVLPSITQATGVRLYLYSRRTKSLERVPTSADPEPMAVPVDSPPEGPASGAVVCFRNRTLLNIPDVRRSPLVKADRKTSLPRSAMYVPLFAQSEVVGVLEVRNVRRPGYFTIEEQASAQHLANQVAASLKLQEQHTMREQLFRSEKLAATGQLISGVASDLRAPLESIVQLTTSLSAYNGRPVPARDLRQLASESQRASEIVSRLVSFARPEASGARHVDVNALVASLMKFREPEWKTLGLRVQNRLAPEPAMIMGAQSQIEQVFLNLMVHAEQCASEAPGKTIAVSGAVIGRRVLVEIGYSAPVPEPSTDPFAEGLGVCQGIIHNHGGEIRYRIRAGVARFEVDLPVAGAAEPAAAADAHKSSTALTLMQVDTDPGGQRQLVALLSSRGHRVVPVPPDESADLAHRLRFDAVLWAMRPAGPRWSEFQERIRTHIPAFVLLSDGYDQELAHSLEESGGFLLSRPVQESELDRILTEIELRR
jgi:signal transduction histidine kinase